VFLGPQILRASAAEYTNVQHSATLPPHHGYVAAYLFYRHRLKADAVIHMGRHGTLEWLPGKSVGQAEWDAAEAILGDLPNLNFYIMDGDGEAIQARRRGLAVDLSHLTPMLARTGADTRFASLEEALKKWEETYEESPLVAEEYKANAVAELKRLKLIDQLKLNPEDPKDLFARVHDFLEAVEEAPLPLGLHTLGEAPAEERQRAGLEAFVGSAFDAADAKKVRSYLAEWTDAIFAGRPPSVPESISGELRERVFRSIDEAHGWLARLRASAPRELEAMVRVLRGEFLPSGLAGDPLAVPDALPSARNLHLGDPALLPSKAGYAVGKKLAMQLLERHRKQHGGYPGKLSMILWGGETGRHQGAMEAQALYLMGIEPEWNARGVPDRLKLIPESELGRPRVNVIFNVSGDIATRTGTRS
jgi:cobaltochelatase CobN